MLKYLGNKLFQTINYRQRQWYKEVRFRGPTLRTETQNTSLATSSCDCDYIYWAGFKPQGIRCWFSGSLWEKWESEGHLARGCLYWGHVWQNTMIEIWPDSPRGWAAPACESWGSYRKFEDLWNIDMETWVVANEQQLLDMIWNGNLTMGLCIELSVFFFWIGSLLWSYSRCLRYVNSL